MVILDINALLPYIFLAYLVVIVVYLILDNRSPQSTLAWLIIIAALPVVGLFFYIFFGRNSRRISRRKKRNRAYVEEQLFDVLQPFSKGLEREEKILDKHITHSQKGELATLFYRNSQALLTSRNKIKIFDNGKEKFDALIRDLEKARHSIHLEYFIWRSDTLTKKIHEILVRKAKAGVEVRLMYDALGSILFNPKDKLTLRLAGVQLHAFSYNPITFNNRNHRKIAVIDGKVGYLGGMNVGEEYVHGGRRFSFWRDTHVRCEGDIVLILQSLFVSGWYTATKEELFSSSYFSRPKKKVGITPVQIVTSGPDSPWESIQQLYFSLINSVDTYLYIQSPYFVPDPAIQSALKTAALRGLDVRLMITGKPDKKIPYWAAFTFFEDLLKAGVKVYHYKKGFLHAKTMCIDDEIATIGTANMDVRSFSLNYEMNAVLYDKKLAKNLKASFMQDLKHSTEFTLRDYYRLSTIKKFRNSLARLFAPIL